MNAASPTYGLVRKVLLFALLGIGLIVLAGPIGVVLGFALVGFLGWFVINLFVHGWRSTGESLRIMFRGLGQVGAGVGRGVTGIGRFGKRAVVGVVTLPGRIWDKIWGLGGNASVWFFEIVSGILAGVLLGAIYDKNTGLREVAIVFGALAGAVLGVVVAHSRRRAAEEPLDVHPAE